SIDRFVNSVKAGAKEAAAVAAPSAPEPINRPTNPHPPGTTGTSPAEKTAKELVGVFTDAQVAYDSLADDMSDGVVLDVETRTDKIQKALDYVDALQAQGIDLGKIGVDVSSLDPLRDFLKQIRTKDVRGRIDITTNATEAKSALNSLRNEAEDGIDTAINVDRTELDENLQSLQILSDEEAFSISVDLKGAAKASRQIAILKKQAGTIAQQAQQPAAVGSDVEATEAQRQAQARVQEKLARISQTYMTERQLEI